VYSGATNRANGMPARWTVGFDEAWPRRAVFEVDGMRVPFIGLDDLINNKVASGRTKDLADVEVLSEHRRRRS
jgi:hypothetical protein